MEIHPFSITQSEIASIPSEIDIWPEGIAGAVLEEDTYPLRAPATHLDRFVANSQRPALYAYPAGADNTGKAVLICPGGGYAGQAIDKEGHDIARFFNSFGVSAFVLKYRVPSINGKRVCDGVFTASLEDALRAMRYIRANADRYGIRKLGVMGFSAGGHLAAMASTIYDEPLEKDARLASISARPDFSVLVYPVITFVTEACHNGSRSNLMGQGASEEAIRHYSPELQVNANTPQCFLAQAEDDVVTVENSIMYFRACREYGVKAEMHLFPEGGHGYGMYQRGLAVDTWPERLKEFLLRNEF